jgi:primary-amine oxidase
MMNTDKQIFLCGPPPFHDLVFNATIRHRGVRMSDVACLPIAIDWYGPAEENRLFFQDTLKVNSKPFHYVVT